MAANSTIERPVDQSAIERPSATGQLPDFETFVRSFGWQNREIGEKLIARCRRLSGLAPTQRQAEDAALREEQARRTADGVRAMRERQRWDGVNFPLGYSGARFEVSGYGEPVTVYPAGWTDAQGRVWAGNERALHLCRRFADGYRTGRKGLILSGAGKGSGKTYFLCAAMAQCVRGGATARYERMPDLLEAIRRSYGRAAGDDDPYALTTAQVMARYTEPDILLLDELGGERIDKGERGDWAREQVLTIIETRYMAAKTLCATTNLTGDGLRNQYGERAVSRLLDRHRAVWVAIDTPDHRLVGPEDDDPFADEQAA